MAKTIEPWERQHGEPDKAFAAFKFYRDTPPANRSIVKCLAAYTGDGPATAARIWQKWSSRWEWQERVKAWANEMDRVGRAEQLAAIRDMNKRHVGIANLMLSKAAERIKAMAVADLTPSEARMFFADAAKLERLARGEPEAEAIAASDITVKIVYASRNNSNVAGATPETE